MEAENISTVNTLDRQIYFVAMPRQGCAPSIEKAVEDGIDGPIFFTWEKACEIRNRVNNRYASEDSYDGGHFEIWEATVVVPIKAPILRDPGQPPR